MSARNIRKLQGKKELPKQDDNSDEDSEPLYAKSSSSKFGYHGLQLSSHSESDHESTDAMSNENVDPKITNKKKKKKKTRQPRLKQLPKISPEEALNMDEIDKSLMEVNAILGDAPKPQFDSKNAQKKQTPRDLLLTIQAKNLDSSYEMKRLFGSAIDESNKKKGRQPNLQRIKKALVVQMNEPQYSFQYSQHKLGISMSIVKQDDDSVHYTFNHSKAYQKMQKAFLVFGASQGAVFRDFEGQELMHIDFLLEKVDLNFRAEEYDHGPRLLEHVIALMQYAACPTFNLASPKTRLEYKYLENRPFHVAVLKYLYVQTSRACHRTALELAKLLLVLDPSDPLAVVLIIDILALRSREHKWLLDSMDCFRDATFMYNMMYSKSLAHYNLAVQKKEDLAQSSEVLRDAMLRFPLITMKIFELSSTTPDPKITGCRLFTDADQNTPRVLKDLIKLYAKLVWSKWREGSAMAWLTKTAVALAEDYNTGKTVTFNNQEKTYQELAEYHKQTAFTAYKGCPEQVKRHLFVLSPLSNLISEGVLPSVAVSGRAADPFPPAETVNRYNYSASPETGSEGILSSLLSSLLPNYDPNFRRLVNEAELVAIEDIDDLSDID